MPRPSHPTSFSTLPRAALRGRLAAAAIALVIAGLPATAAADHVSDHIAGPGVSALPPVEVEGARGGPGSVTTPAVAEQGAPVEVEGARGGPAPVLSTAPTVTAPSAPAVEVEGARGGPARITPPSVDAIVLPRTGRPDLDETAGLLPWLAFGAVVASFVAVWRLRSVPLRTVR